MVLVVLDDESDGTRLEGTDGESLWLLFGVLVVGDTADSGEVDGEAW